MSDKTQEKISAIIDEISLLTLMAEPEDRTVLNDIHNKITLLLPQFETFPQKLLFSAASALSEYIKKEIDGNGTCSGNCYDVINRSITSIQFILSSGENATDAVFPEELGLDSNPVSLEDALNNVSKALDELSAAAGNKSGKIRIAAERCSLIVSELISGHLPEQKDFLAAVSAVAESMNSYSGNGKKLSSEGLSSDIRLKPVVKGDEEILADTGQIAAEFLQMLYPMLENMERSILVYEKSNSENILEDIRKIVHRIKGDSGMVGISDINKVSSGLNNYIIDNRGKISVDTLLKAKDFLYEAAEFHSGNTETKPEIDPVLRSFSGAAAAPDKIIKTNITDTEEITGDTDLLNDFIGEATEHAESADSALLILEKTPDDNESVNTVFRCFHTLKSLAGFLGLNDIHSLVKQTENLLHLVRKNEIKIDASTIDVLFGSVDLLKKQVSNLKEALTTGTAMKREKNLNLHLSKIGIICSEEIAVNDNSRNKTGEILLSEGKISKIELEKILNEQSVDPAKEKIGEMLVSKHLVSKEDVEEALDQQSTNKIKVRIKETIKIESEKLDRLIDTIGEIVIAESMVHNTSAFNAAAEYEKNLGHLNKTTKRLHEFGLSLRLIPLATTFQKMSRLVRDLSKNHNKKINFILSGEDTEIDRSVVEKLNDPLIHMLRNAVDHGIENSISERVDSGKDEEATLKLSAYHKGGSIYMIIEDDGKGLDREKILQRAKENNLLDKSEDDMTDEEVFSYIFRPGFSTASVVTDTSGRGVGMDVVKKNIEAVHGRIEIDSKKGKGTKFTIIMPLTTAIIEAMVLRVGKEKYLLPTLAIIESMRPRYGDITTVQNRGMVVNFRGTLVPVFSMSRLFLDKEESAEDIVDKIIVVIEDDGKKVGIVVDELLEQQQVVVKSLGNGIDKTPGVGGCTIMSDGKVGLILDTGEIVKMTTLKEEVRK